MNGIFQLESFTNIGMDGTYFPRAIFMRSWGMEGTHDGFHCWFAAHYRNRNDRSYVV